MNAIIRRCEQTSTKTVKHEKVTYHHADSVVLELDACEVLKLQEKEKKNE